jgi:hypothetical protein
LIEGVLGGLAEPRATLRAPPRRDPAWATFGGLSPVHPGKGLTGAYAEVLHRAPLRACWPDTSANKLATPLGKKKKDLSATMADDKEALCNLDPKNIIDMTDGDVLDAKRQAFKEYQKARREAEWKDFISGFQKTHDGKVVEVQEFEFPPLQQPKVTPTMSKPLESNSDIATHD